jgi:hypothetical protein
VRWASITQRTLPLDAIAGVIEHLATAYPDGIVRVQRRAYVGLGSWHEAAPGTWQRVSEGATFPLLDVTSTPGQESPAATRQWTATRHALRALIERGQLVDTAA